MKDDPAVQRVRKARHEISAECGHDPQKLVAYYLERKAKAEVGRQRPRPAGGASAPSRARRPAP